MGEDDEIQIPVSLPLDTDGFLRRECPACEQEFKWFNHAEGDPDTEPVTQYYCPICGEPAPVDHWWTPAQVQYSQASAGPEIERLVQDSVAGMLKGIKRLTFKRNSSFSLGIETPEPLTEPDDMVIVEPPCHPNVPLKVPENTMERVYCLVCRTPFAA